MKEKKEGKVSNTPLFFLMLAWFQKFLNQSLIKEKLTNDYVAVFIPIPKKGNAKECSNYCTTAFISHASKVMLQILQARIQQYVNCEFQMFKLDLEKAEELEIKLPTSIGS